MEFQLIPNIETTLLQYPIEYQEPGPGEHYINSDDWQVYMEGDDPFADKPFEELTELAHDERIRFERVLLAAIENYISLGATKEDLLDIIDDLFG